MSYIIHKESSRTTPLCWLPCGDLVCYKEGCVIVYGKNNSATKFPIFLNIKERLLAKNNVLYRGLRLGIRSSIALDDNTILLSTGSHLYELNLSSKLLSKGFFLENGIRPLIYTKVKNICEFDDGIYFGGYLTNSLKNSVNVYHRIGVDQWKVVYTFPQGAINHVHNIVPDPYRQCLWVFTGDFGEASAIWKVKDNFKTVERVVCDDQKYRGCVVYALPEGLLYATDAPFSDDYIYLMNTDTYEMNELFPIHGSCIYGCQWKDKYVFSSTVEGDGRKMSRMEWLFTRKRGAGVKDNFVHIYMGNLQEGFKEIYKEKKDCLPFYTFQFGVFKFPAGVNNSDTLYFQPVATKKHDLRLLSLSLVMT